MDTLIQKHLVEGDIKEALLEEINYLATSPDYAKYREKLDLEKLDVMDPIRCFVGQMGNDWGIGHNYREYVGKLQFVGGYSEMTPLEIWSACRKREGNDKIIMEVAKHIKSGGEYPLPEIEFNDGQYNKL